MRRRPSRGVGFEHGEESLDIDHPNAVGPDLHHLRVALPALGEASVLLVGQGIAATSAPAVASTNSRNVEPLTVCDDMLRRSTATLPLTRVPQGP